MLLLCALGLLAACDTRSRPEDVFDASKDTSTGADAMADAAPRPAPEDARPPAEEDTGGASAPRLSVDRLLVTEGAPAVTFRATVNGVTPRGGWEVSVEAPGLVFSPTVARLEGNDPSANFDVEALVDADEMSARGEIVVRALSGAVEHTTRVPFIVRDTHLTLDLSLSEAALEALRTSIDRAPRWPVEVRASGVERPRATFNLRGQGTIFCARKSLTLRFEAPTTLGTSPPSEGFVLLALCEDPTLLRSRVAFEQLQSVGLFPPWFGFAEVKLNGETNGLYLVVERPRDAIARGTPSNTRVLRRRSPERVVEVDRPDVEDIANLESFLAPYYALLDLPTTLTGEALLAALRARMDFDQYLSMVAFNSALENGDNIDELYFYDAPHPARAPTPGGVPYWRVMAWDQDEIFRPCHVAQPSPDPALYCAESVLDDLVRTSLPARVAYIAALRQVLEGPLRPVAVRSAAERAAAEVRVYLERPGLTTAHFGETPPPDLAVEVEAWLARLNTRRAALGRLGLP